MKFFDFIVVFMFQVKGEFVNFFQKLLLKLVIEGEVLDLIVKVIGIELITVIWLKDRKLIKDFDGYKIFYDKGICRLYIVDVKFVDLGEFKVEVKNQFGFVFCFVSFGVKGK